VLLTHVKEYKRERTGTGRLACINLANCEIIPGLAFDRVPRVRELADDPGNYPVLLYPSPGAIELGSDDTAGAGLAEELGDRRLVVFLIDATWACSRSALRASPRIASLPRLKFRPRELSRWVIKRQPRDYCLSTIEAVHELLAALEAAGLDTYPDKGRLLEAFAAMQDYQLERSGLSSKAASRSRK
jgi:DTW domain-containing protein